jgi:hypothetical protein
MYLSPNKSDLANIYIATLSVGIVIGYRLDGVQPLAGARDFSLLHSGQTSSEMNPASHPTIQRVPGDLSFITGLISEIGIYIIFESLLLCIQYLSSG